MKKFVKIVALTGLAVVLSSGFADAAGKDSVRKKKTLFDSLFGVNNSTDKPARRKNRGRNWWDSGSDVRIISGDNLDGVRTRKGNVISAGADDDPEGDPGFGMGNLTYVQDKTFPLSGLKLTETRPATEQAGAVYDALSGPGDTYKAIAPIRDAVAEHYKSRNFTPVWTGADGKLSPRGEAVLKFLAAAGEEGLEPESYLPPVLGRFDAPPPSGGAAAMARLDIDLTAAVVKYARDASGGQFDPRKLSRYNDVTPAWIDVKQAVKVLGFTPYPVEYLAALHPSLPAYAAMKAALADIRKSSGVAVADPIPDGDIVKKGKTDERIPAIRQRLADLGYPDALLAASEPEILDADLVTQVRLFQKAAGIKVTGSIGPQTVAALNADSSGKDMARLLDNMERLRWLPKSLGHRYVFVNQAAFEARVMDGAEEVWKTRVIIGKPNTQTAVFHDEMEMVVFNPSWGVPPSIIANEYLPKLRRDPGYLDRIGFKVVNQKGKVVSSSSVDWGSYGAKVPYGIQQPPGVKNALGEVKFLFPNAHNIYMHDTPNRNLFENDVRAFSHGCVRVQNPLDFASVILGWDRTKIDAKVEGTASETVKLPHKIPVHLTYFTAWPDETGKIQFFNDIYGRDKTMENARSAIVLAER